MQEQQEQQACRVPDGLGYYTEHQLSGDEQTFVARLMRENQNIADWILAGETDGAQVTTARTAFITFLNAKLSATPDRTVVQSQGLESFLGEEGTRLYKAACEEEYRDSRFRKRLIASTFKTYTGDTQGKFHVIVLGGPSGAGKSTSAAQLVQRYIPADRDAPNKNHPFAMAFVDGGIYREVNHMHKILKHYAELQGVVLTGFHRQTDDINKEVKTGMRDLAYGCAANIGQVEDRMPVGVVEVETFSSDASPGISKKQYKKIREKLQVVLDQPNPPQLNVITAIVGGDDPGIHPQNVRAMATYRADPSVDPEFILDKHRHRVENNWGGNAGAISGLKEYKPYSVNGYVSGMVGSWLAALKFWKFAQSQNVAFKLVRVENPVQPYDARTGELWDKTSPMRIATPAVASKAKELMVREQELRFDDACNRIMQNKDRPEYAPLLKLNMTEVTTDHPDLTDAQQRMMQKLTDLLKKQMHVGVKAVATGTAGNVGHKMFKRLMHRISVKTKTNYSWAEKNIPYTVEAFDIIRATNMLDRASVSEATKKIGALIQKKTQSYGLWSWVFAWRRNMLPVLQDIHQELQAREQALVVKHAPPVYHAMALAKLGGIANATPQQQEYLLQLAILTASVRSIANVMPAAFVDYAKDAVSGIRAELSQVVTTDLSRQLIQPSTSFSRLRLFHKEHLRRDPGSQEIFDQIRARKPGGGHA